MARDTVVAMTQADEPPIEMRQAVAACRLLGALFGDDATIEFDMDDDGNVSSVSVIPPNNTQET